MKTDMLINSGMIAENILKACSEEIRVVGWLVERLGRVGDRLCG